MLYKKFLLTKMFSTRINLTHLSTLPTEISDFPDSAATSNVVVEVLVKGSKPAFEAAAWSNRKLDNV